MTKFSGPLLHTEKSSAAGREWFGGAPSAFDPDYTYFVDDFNRVAVDLTNDWTEIKDAGAAAAAIVADAANGLLRISSTATTDNDGGSIQGNEIYLPAAGKTIWFEAKVRASDVDHDMFIGLTQNFATDPEAVLAASNRIGFQITEGSAVWLAKSEIADAETSTSTGVTQVAATFDTVGFRVNGVSTIEFFVNRNLVATHTSVPATELTPAFFNLSGNATGTHTADVDYIAICATR